MGGGGGLGRLQEGIRAKDYALCSEFLLFLHLLNPLQGGEVIQESITSNIGEDLITLEFQKTDGTLITQLIDFRNVSNK